MIKDCHVGVKGIVKVGDRCLVLQKGEGESAYWDIPGGRIDDNETLLETLARELAEELPSLKQFRIEGVVDAYRLSKNIADNRGLVLVFYRVDAAPFKIELSKEHVGYRWVTKDDVQQLLENGPRIERGYYDAIVTTLTNDTGV